MTRHNAARLAVIAGAVLAVTAGCGQSGDTSAKEPDNKKSADSSSATPHKDSTEAPTAKAAEAGGICEYLEFEALSKATGQAFTVAESGGSEEVTSCVVQTTQGSFPDITLTKAKTATDTKTYEKTIPPKEHEEVKSLGKAAYSAVRKSVEKSGPVVEIGWLTKGKMYSLRYTTVANTPRAEAEASVNGLVDVAKVAEKIAKS